MRCVVCVWFYAVCILVTLFCVVYPVLCGVYYLLSIIFPDIVCFCMFHVVNMKPFLVSVTH